MYEMTKNVRLLSPQKTIALIAHDHKKDELLEWVKKHSEVIQKPQLYQGVSVLNNFKRQHSGII